MEDINDEYRQELSKKRKKSEINTYYSKRYREQIYLMKYVCLYVVILICVLVLRRYDVFGDTIQNLAIALVCVSAIIHLGKQFVNFYFRNTIHFDEIDWPFNRNANSGEEGESIEVGYDDEEKECGPYNS